MPSFSVEWAICMLSCYQGENGVDKLVADTSNSAIVPLPGHLQVTAVYTIYFLNDVKANDIKVTVVIIRAGSRKRLEWPVTYHSSCRPRRVVPSHLVSLILWQGRHQVIKVIVTSCHVLRVLAEGKGICGEIAVITGWHCNLIIPQDPEVPDRRVCDTAVSLARVNV